MRGAVPLGWLLGLAGLSASAAPAALADQACNEPAKALALIAAGAVPSGSVLSKVIECGTTPDGSLDEAHEALFRLLLSRGVDPSEADEDGMTPMLMAACRGNGAVIEPLARAGASPTATNRLGETPVSFARGISLISTCRGSAAVVDALLRVSPWLRLERALLSFSTLQTWATPPLWLALVVLVWRWRARPLPVAVNRVSRGDDLPRLATLKCERCGAPTPIAPADLACPSCSAPITVPPDYGETLAARGRVAEEVREAVKRWRRVLFLGTRWVTTPLMLAGLAWLPLVLLGHFSPFNAVDGGRAIDPAGGLAGYCFVLSTSLVWAVALIGYATHLGNSRSRVPPMPSADKLGAAEAATCGICGAPLRFEAGELVACCGYCGGECYRVALARAARRDAERAEDQARVSIVEAMGALEARARAAASALVIAGSVVLALALALGGVILSS